MVYLPAMGLIPGIVAWVVSVIDYGQFVPARPAARAGAGLQGPWAGRHPWQRSQRSPMKAGVAVTDVGVS